MKIKKIHNMATFDKPGDPSDIGYDLTACSFEYKKDGLWFIGTGIQVEPDYGTYLEIVPRSSFFKTPFFSNIGIIDSGYRGEIKFQIRYCELPFWRDYLNNQEVNKIVIIEHIQDYLLGKRIAQAIIRQIVRQGIVFVDNLSETIRGENGFGSTGQ